MSSPRLAVTPSALSSSPEEQLRDDVGGSNRIHRQLPLDVDVEAGCVVVEANKIKDIASPIFGNEAAIHGQTSGEDLAGIHQPMDGNSFLLPAFNPEASLSGHGLGLSTVICGSPGHTPFPDPVIAAAAANRTSFDFPDAASISSGSDSFSSMPPPPPCNSPADDDDDEPGALMKALKTEAERQEAGIKAALDRQRRRHNNLIPTQLFASPAAAPPNIQTPGGVTVTSDGRQKIGNPLMTAGTATAGTATAAAAAGGKVGGALAASSRRNRKDVCLGMSAAEVEKMAEVKNGIREWKSPISVKDKEVRRRLRINTSISMLRKIVPGVTDETENTQVFEAAAKYMAYLKKEAGNGVHDKEFLAEYMPL